MKQKRNVLPPSLSIEEIKKANEQCKSKEFQEFLEQCKETAKMFTFVED